MFLINNEARESLIRGLDKVANAVKLTLGPRGRVAAIHRGFGPIEITKDGVSVAREVKVDDPFEKIGAELIKEAAIKTNDVAGDGTTTATVLTQSLLKNAIDTQIHPTILKEELENCLQEVTKRLEEKSKSVRGNLDSIEWVATTSANNDHAIGKLIRDAVGKIGEDGIILVGDSNNAESKIEVLEGMRFDVGYISPYFVTNIEKQTVEYDNPIILVTEHKIENVQDLLPIMEFANSNDRPLVIVADDFETTCASTLIRNKIQNNFKVVAIKMNGFGDFKKENLGDLATFTNATVITSDVGLKLTGARPSHLGECGRIVVSNNKVVFLDGKGEGMEERFSAVKAQTPIENTYNQGRHAERLARLSGKVAIIKVGAITESELRERKDRVEDAVNAVKSALEAGVVPGGGITLWLISKEIGTDYKEEWESLIKALESPFRTIVDSTGQDFAFVAEKVLSGRFFDAKNLTFIGMDKVPILDTVKSIKIALETAVSIATSVLMTEVLINAESRRDTPSPVPFG